MTTVNISEGKSGKPLSAVISGSLIILIKLFGHAPREPVNLLIVVISYFVVWVHISYVNCVLYIALLITQGTVVSYTGNNVWARVRVRTVLSMRIISDHDFITYVISVWNSLCVFFGIILFMRFCLRERMYSQSAWKSIFNIASRPNTN